MWLGNLDLAIVPSQLVQLLEISAKRPIALAQALEPLSEAPVDHVALTLATPRDVRRCWQDLVDLGGQTVEAVHLWPNDNPGCPSVPDADRKWMATVRLKQAMLVLLSPHAQGDVLDRFVTMNGGPGVHHIAFRVTNIADVMASCTTRSGTRQLTPLAEDKPYLSQVFLRSQEDVRIVELVERSSAFDGTFTCRNIAALTAGERNDVMDPKQQEED